MGSIQRAVLGRHHIGARPTCRFYVQQHGRECRGNSVVGMRSDFRDELLVRFRCRHPGVEATRGASRTGRLQVDPQAKVNFAVIVSATTSAIVF